MPATGSSSSSNCGSCTSSMPISRNCFCPCDSNPAWRWARGSRRKVLSTWSMRWRCSALSRAVRLAHTDLSALSASSRFSNTVSASNTVGFWNLRPIPAWAICTSLIEARSRVSPNQALPWLGRVLPVITSIKVVLPAPLGPMMQRSSPTPMYRFKAFKALKPSKLTLMSSRVRMVPWRTSSALPALRAPRPMASRLLPASRLGSKAGSSMNSGRTTGSGTVLIVHPFSSAARKCPWANTGSRQ
ncbi:hypothetical protein D3C80_1146510 [compost metagenome]